MGAGWGTLRVPASPRPRVWWGRPRRRQHRAHALVIAGVALADVLEQIEPALHGRALAGRLGDPGRDSLLGAAAGGQLLPQPLGRVLAELERALLLDKRRAVAVDPGLGGLDPLLV